MTPDSGIRIPLEIMCVAFVAFDWQSGVDCAIEGMVNDQLDTLRFSDLVL